MKVLSRVANGILAGIMISIGGSVFLACFGDGSVLYRAIAAFFFTIALLCICLKGYSLYTGKIGFIPEKHDREAVSILLWGLLGNILATAICGLAVRYAIPYLETVAVTACAAKLTQAWWQTLIRGIFCGILMFIAVSVYRDKNTVSAILFCVPVFILSGFEHSIANMFYFAVSGDFFSVRGAVYLALVVLGNSLGAVMMPLLAAIRPKNA